MNSLNMPDYYQLLKLNYDAGLEDVKESYKSICDQFSILYTSSRQDILSVNKELVVYKDAFDTLTNPQKKLRYDENLKGIINQKAINLENSHKNIISDTSDLNESFLKDSTVKFEINKFKEEILKDNFMKGKDYLNNGQYHEAINAFRKLISLKSKEAKFHSYLALALDKKGWHDYAEEEFKISIELDPEDIISKRYFENKIAQKEAKKTSFLIVSEDFEVKTKKHFWESFKTFVAKVKKL